MTTSEELGKYLQTIIERHRKDLSILLEENGIYEEPTPKLLILLYEKAGDNFIHELATLGEEPFEGLPIEHLEGTLIDRLSNFFQKAKSIVTSVSGDGSSAAAATTTQASAPAAGISTKKILIAGSIILVVLTVIYLIIKRSN